MFYLSKALSIFTQPLVWAVVLFLLALWGWSRHRVAARCVLLAAFGWTVLVGWLLLTSARHMPRAMSIFQAVGWNVTPYPVDYRGVRPGSWADYSLARGMVRWQLVLHEWLGLLAFAVLGWAGF